MEEGQGKTAAAKKTTILVSIVILSRSMEP
jgi:hypothetical protein